jgi:polyisoprenoid-binding protein YceI
MLFPFVVENRLRRAGLGLSVAVAVLGAPGASADPSWEVSQAEVRVTCPMTVGGSFEATTTALTGALTPTEPHGSRLSGAITVDLGSLDTGIGLRNDHMREEYLQVGKGPGYEKAVLSDIRLGEADLSGFDGHTPFTGTLLLHGVAHAVSGRAEVHRQGPAARVEARFGVELPDYGIPEPRYLGVGVRDRVEVRVRLLATPSAPTGGAR